VKEAPDYCRLPENILCVTLFMTYDVINYCASSFAVEKFKCIWPNRS